MNDRDRSLTELRQGIGGIDPVLDQAANYGKGVRAVQKVMHEQGQVMSAALSNNHALYHTNKKLVGRLREIDAENASLIRRVNLLADENLQLSHYVAKLEAGGGDRFRPLYEQAQRTLNAYLFDALTQDELRARLGDMNAQAKEIEAMPDKATDEEINAQPEGEYSLPTGFEGP
jgi:hypothetical protein